MGSSSSGFFLRPLLMNLASSAGVMPLWGIVAFDDVELEYPRRTDVFLWCSAQATMSMGASQTMQPNNAFTKGCPAKAGALRINLCLLRGVQRALRSRRGNALFAE